MKTTVRQCILAFLRSILSFILFIALSALLTSAMLGVFEALSFDFSAENSFLESLLRSLCFYFAMIAVSWTISRFAKKRRWYFLQTNPDVTAFHAKEQAISLLSSPAFWCEVIPCALLILITPFFGAIERLFTGQTAENPEIAMWIRLPALILPLVLITLLLHMRDRRKWVEHREQYADETAPREISVKRLIKTILIWTLNLLLLPALIAILYTTVWPIIRNLGKELLYLALIIILLVLLYHVLVRVFTLFKRRKFIRQLQTVCDSKNYTLSLYHPYRSLLWRRDEVGLSVEAKGKQYDCKLLHTFTPRLPIILDPDGIFWRLRPIRFVVQISVIQSQTSIDLDFSLNEKVLILNPGSRFTYLGNPTHKREAATGDKIGGCTIYTSTSFCNYLDRL